MRMPEDVFIHSWRGDEDLPKISEVHAEVPQLKVAGVMPQAEVRRRSKDMEIERLQTPGWKILTTPNSVVRGNIHHHGLRTVGVYAEEMNVMLRAEIGGGDAAPFRFRLFKEPRDFRMFAVRSGAANAESFYDPRTMESSFCFKIHATHEIFQRAFAHEFTHEFMDVVWRRTDPLWFAEGMAEYFSNLEWRGGILLPGRINRRALLILQTAKPQPLEKFFGMGRDEMYGAHFAKFYAQAWAIVHFLFNRSPETIHHLLDHGTLGGIFIADMERDWLSYLDDLSPHFREVS